VRDERRQKAPRVSQDDTAENRVDMVAGTGEVPVACDREERPDVLGEHDQCGMSKAALRISRACRGDALRERRDLRVEASTSR
jgi:hypothetical protein